MTYKRNKEVTYSCKYHVVWCTKYRRPVLIDDVEVRLRELLTNICDQRDIELVEMKLTPDHVHLLIEVEPHYGIHLAVKEFKRQSSRVLRNEFPQVKSRIPTLWTNCYFVATTGDVPVVAISQYIEDQKRV